MGDYTKQAKWFSQPVSFPGARPFMKLQPTCTCIVHLLLICSCWFPHCFPLLYRLLKESSIPAKKLNIILKATEDPKVFSNLLMLFPQVYILQEAGANNWRRSDMLKHWMRYGGVMVMGYSMYRNLSQCYRVRSKTQKKVFQEALVDPGRDNCTLKELCKIIENYRFEGDFNRVKI